MKTNKQKRMRLINKNGDLLLYGLIVLLTLINLSLVNNDSVWCDEAFSMILCREDFANLMENVRVDAWPPFYSMASWGYAQIFGATVPALKTFSLIPGILTMILGATIIKKEFKSNYISAVFIVLVGLMPISLHANIEIRGYSWAMFFVTYCGLLAYKYYIYGHKWKTFLGMTLFGLLAAYTHYFALVTIALIYLALFIALCIKKFKNILFCLTISVISIIAYLPWLRYFFKATKSVSSGFWISEISISQFLKYFIYPFTNYFDNFGNVELSDFSFVLLFACILIFFLLVEKVWHQKNKKSQIEIFALISLSMWGLTITIGFILSRLISPMFIGRYMYPSVGLLWLFIAIGIYRCVDSRKILIAFLALLTTVGFYSYAGQRIVEYENGTDVAKKVIASNYEKGMGIFSDSDYLNWTEIKYYFPDSTHSERGGEMDVITDKGTREEFLFLCTKDFSEYETAFLAQGYNIESLGNYDFDGNYYFELFIITQ